MTHLLKSTSTLLVWCMFIGYIHAIGEVEYCARDKFTASCSDGSVILITSAKYGRMRIGKCVQSGLGNLGCQKDVIGIVDGLCSGKQTCEFFVGINEALLQTDPCNQLLSYLEVSYQCFSVAASMSDNCHLTQSEMHLSGDLKESINCGSHENPWKIIANPGQTITLTLYDFTKQPDVTTSDCEKLGFVSERNLNINKTICSSQTKRTTVVYSSVSHEVEVMVLMESSRRRKGAFLVYYQISGCPDPYLHNSAYYQRDGLRVEIGCKSEEKVWHLECRNDQWEGVVGNCSRSTVDEIPDSTESSSYGLPQSLIIALIIGGAILFSSMVLVCGLVCMSKNGQLNCCDDDDKQNTIDYASMRYANHAKRLPTEMFKEGTISRANPHMNTCSRNPTICRDGSQKGQYMRPNYSDDQFLHSHVTQMTPDNYAVRECHTEPMFTRQV